MTNLPFFSVVVPTYNSLETLQQTIEGLLGQNYPSDRYEIIIIDDGSTDGTTDYLEQMGRQGRLFFQPQTHKGPGGARNHGARLGHGEILAFIDSDCLPASNWLTALAKGYEAPQSPDAVGCPIEITPFDHWLYHFYLCQKKRHRNNHLPTPLFLDTANASFRRSAFLAVGGFDERFPFAFEDIDLGYRLRLAGYCLQTTLEAVVWHYEPDSLFRMMHKSFQYGQGQEIFRRYHPEVYEGLPSWGWHLVARDWLNNKVRQASRAPAPIRPVLYGLAVALRRCAYFVPEIAYDYRHYLHNQFARYNELPVNSLHRAFYGWLEWMDYLPHLVGELVCAHKLAKKEVEAGL